MESLIIPGIILGLAVACFLVSTREDSGLFGIAGKVLVLVFLFSFFLCPLYRQTISRNAELQAQAYYESVIAPNVVEEYDDIVVVAPNLVALWQAGGYNLSAYNAYLQKNRYWDSIPIIGSVIYPAPPTLKLVHVQEFE